MLAMSNLQSAPGHDTVKAHLPSCLKTRHEINGLPAPRSTAFDNLVLDINRVLGPSNGIDSDGVDVRELMMLMEQYRSCRSDWDHFAFAGAYALLFDRPINFMAPLMAD
jgi:cysteine dioxygenase